MRIIFSLLLIGCSGLSSAEVGVTDKEILIGGHTVASGPYGFYGVISRTAKAYFQHINDTEGGIYGRKIKYIPEDSGWNRAKALGILRKHVEKDKVFATFMNLGDSHLAGMKYLEKKKVPDMYVADSSLIYTNPTSKMRFDSMPPFYMEGRTMGKWIAENMAGKKVGFLVFQGTVGKEGVKGAKEELKGKVKFGPVEKIGLEAPNANQQILNLKRAKCDIVLVFAFPPLAPNAIKFAGQKDFKPQWFVQLYTSNSTFTKIAGEAGEGVMGNQYLHYEHENVAAIRRHKEIVKKYMPDVVPDNLTIYGQYVAEYMVETLKRAGKKLTRQSLVKAAETYKDWKCSVCRVPISTSATDHAAFDTTVKMTKHIKGKWTFLEDIATKSPSSKNK